MWEKRGFTVGFGGQGLSHLMWVLFSWFTTKINNYQAGIMAGNPVCSLHLFVYSKEKNPFI